MEYKEIFKAIKKAFNSNNNKLGYVDLGDDYNPCRKHIEIIRSNDNMKDWDNILYTCYGNKRNANKAIKECEISNDTPAIYIGRQGNRSNYTYIIAILTKDAWGGYFHLYDDCCYFDGEVEFDTDEEEQTFKNNILEKIYAIMPKG